MVPPRNLRLMVSFFKLSISNKKQIFFISLFSQTVRIRSIKFVNAKRRERYVHPPGRLRTRRGAGDEAYIAASPGLFPGG